MPDDHPGRPAGRPRSVRADRRPPRRGRRCRHERHRQRAGRDGTPRLRQRSEGFGPARPAAGRGRAGRDRSRRRQSRVRGDVVAVSTAIPSGQPRGGRGPRRRGPGPPAGRDPGGDRRGAPHGRRWPGPTARRRPGRCSRWSWSRPGCDPSFIIGGEVNEIGSGRRVGRRRVVRGRGRRERRHLPRARRRDRGRHQRRTRPPRALRRPTRSCVAAFADFVAGARSGVVACVPTTRGRPSSSPRRRRSPTAIGATPTYRIVDLEAGRDGTGFVRRALGCTTGSDRACRSRAPQRPQRRRRPWSPRLQLGASFDAAGRALARFGGVARRFEFRGEAGGVTFVDDYAHLPDRGRGGARGGPRRRAGAVSSACSSPTATAARRRCGRTSPTPSIDADVVVVTDIYCAGEDPGPRGHRPAGRRRDRRRRRRPSTWSGTRHRRRPGRLA